MLAVVGPAFSGPAMVAAPLYSEAGLAVVTPSATNVSLTEQGFQTFLRATPSDRHAGEAIGDFLYGHPEVLAARVIDDGSAYGIEMADAVEEGVEDYLESRVSMPSDAADMTEVAQDIVESEADSVAFLGYYPQTASLAVALRSEGFQGVLISGDGSMDPEFVNLASEAAEGWYLVCPCHDPSVSSDGQEFAQEYENTIGHEPGLTSARTYDVTAMIIETVAAIGPAAADRATVLEELADIRYDGISGEFAFEGDGEYDGSGPGLYRVSGGEFSPLGRAEDYDYADI